MNRLFYLPVLLFGLTACSNQNSQQNPDSVNSQKNIAPSQETVVKKNIKDGNYSAIIDENGKVLFHIEASEQMPSRLGDGMLEIEGFNYKCKDIALFGNDGNKFLAMLTEDGNVAFLDLKESASTGDTRCSELLPEFKNAKSFSVNEDKHFCYVTGEDGSNNTIEPFDGSGYYTYHYIEHFPETNYYTTFEYEVHLTKDYKITIYLKNTEETKSGTFYIDHSMDADGPDASSSLLVAKIGGKTYNITFGYDHFELPENDEKRNNYTFSFDSEDFTLEKDKSITFRRFEASQFAN